MSAYRDIARLLERNTGAQRLSIVFDDFVEMTALSFRNAVDRQGREAREEHYLAIAGKYTRDQLDRFANAIALVVLEMEREPANVLGRLYMELDLGNERLGQFYTPYDVAKLMAGMIGNELAARIARDGIAEIYEPACGAAAFLVARAVRRRFDQASVGADTGGDRRAARASPATLPGRHHPVDSRGRRRLHRPQPAGVRTTLKHHPRLARALDQLVPDQPAEEAR